MHRRITVHLGRGGVDDAAAAPACHFDQALSAEHAGGECRVGIVLVMHRRRRTREVEYQLGVDVHGLTHVPHLEVKMRMATCSRKIR